MLDDALQEFFDDHELKGSSPRTVKFYRDNIKRFREHAQPTLVTDWNSRTITRFLVEKRRTCTDNGLYTYYRALAIVSGFLYRRGYLPSNPMNDVVKLKRNRKDKPEPFTTGDIHALLAVAKAAYNPLRAEALLLTLLDTGIRAGELCNLTLADIDWQSRCLTVTGKTGKRIVPIGRRALRVLRRYIEQERKAPSPGERHVFLAQGNPINTAFLTRYLHQLCNRAGMVRAKKGPHTLRHTFAYTFLQAGGDVFHLKDILGHSDISMTERYIRLMPEDLRRAHHKFSPVEQVLG